MSEPCSCGHGCACGCCEGTEPLTPQSIANRPGLDALSYRVGTYGSFLETMKARLSSQALLALTTREENDASIALLDSWAVVGDVLSFYQERIANEGYLRTATERRSVLELARLVGYSPRPGVAASTYLAYTLDPGPETVIPAGAAARSVPGPGELPQTFETSEDLVARAEWNILQVRLTRPQQPGNLTPEQEEGQLPKTPALYFKGITTNLKPNDPLLIFSGRPDPELFRALTVTPDAVNDRTRVEVNLWWQPPLFHPEMARGPASESSLSAETLRETLERASDLETLKISRGALAREVLSHLEPLKAALDAEAGEPELRAAIEEALPKLRESHATAVERKANRVEPWVSGLMADLEGAATEQGGERSTADPGLEMAATSDNGGTGGVGSQTTSLTSLLGSLGKPAKPQPRSSAHLERDPQKLFGLQSDLPARMLAVAKPELRDGLYKAWANLPATEPPRLKVCALRTRAAVFGHNAPREPVRNAAGVIIDTKEWDLEQRTETSGETFHLTLRPILDTPGLRLGVAVTIGSVALAEQTFPSPNPTPVLQKDQVFTINHPLETISFKVIEVPSFAGSSLPFRFEFRFVKRSAVVTLRGSFSNVGGGVTERLAATSTHSGEVATNYFFQVAGIAAGNAASFSSGPVVSGELTTIEVTGTVQGSLDGEDDDVLYLDNSYPQVKPDGWIVLERPDSNLSDTPLVIATARTVKDVSRAAYGVSGKSTGVELSKSWLQFNEPQPDTFAVIRGTAVYAQCEELELVDEPIAEALCGGEIELAQLYDGLQPGRWLVVSGERADLTDANGNPVAVSGVPAAELMMVAGVEQRLLEEEGQALPGESFHTTLTLAKPLQYCYRRDTVKVYGNVAHATHGETRFEVLGSGDAAKPYQSFTLKQPPLTYVSAPTPSGIESTLQPRVNDVLWHQATCPAGLGPADRIYFVRIDDGGQTTVIFGDGKRGARLPTGTENVRAAYRSGIGKGGNLKAGQISQLATRPLGVKDVINPIPATGGASAESRDQARRNAPLAVMALDRLVSTQDYADFARTFAGVGKTSATRITDGRVELVHVTIAGEDDIPIREDSDLFVNLEAALRLFGDPRQPLRLALRQRSFLVVQADVKVLPDYLWDKVEPKIRAAMVEAFGFARRDLGEDALLSEVYRTIQGIAGVDYVDVNLFASRDPENLEEELDLVDQPKKRLRADLARIEGGEILPAQLLYLSPEVPDTLILKERKS